VTALDEPYWAVEGCGREALADVLVTVAARRYAEDHCRELFARYPGLSTVVILVCDDGPSVHRLRLKVGKLLADGGGLGHAEGLERRQRVGVVPAGGRYVGPPEGDVAE
jgi:hypothetical protein